MNNHYEKYLQRLRAKRMARPEYDAYQKVQSGMAPTVKAIDIATKGGMKASGGSIGAIAMTGMRSQEILQDAASNQFGMATERMNQRNDMLDSQIDQMQMQADMARDAGKDGLLKTGLQVGGSVLGGIAGSVIPGAGTMVGAQIGAGLGDMAAGFVGGGGKLGTEYINPDQVARGFTDTIEGISSAAKLKNHRDIVRRLGGSFEALRDSGKMEMAYFAILSKDVDMLESILDSLNTEDLNTEAPDAVAAVAEQTESAGIDLDDALQVMQGASDAAVNLRDEVRAGLTQEPGAQIASTEALQNTMPDRLLQVIAGYGTGNNAFYERKFMEFLRARIDDPGLNLDAWLSRQTRMGESTKNAMRGMWRNYGQ